MSIVDSRGGGATVNGRPTATSEARARLTAQVPLQSLAARYDKAQHQTYLARLNAAVEDEANCNIALTGRYGSGKSSVLNEFERAHEKTRRLAISTLAPDPDDTKSRHSGPNANTTTNRIQKELVKQLIYSADPSTLRHSRFSRISPLPWWPTFWQSAAGTFVIGALLALLGWLPPVVGTGEGQPWYRQLGIWIFFGAMLSGALTVGRRQLHGRFFVSDLSAAGTALKLSPRTPTYFDEYLEEIVNYFDQEDVDIVILEDLDRFDDPHIFEALRELNTLLNNTQKRNAKGVPLRFVYAVRDSLFEKLGTDTEAMGDDAAAVEAFRANRTKFFDIVIPLVPFISHRNARELLIDLLWDAGIRGVDRRLVSLVAQHATDMRLMRNIRNEYLVFAERLLECNQVAPGLSASNVFALVAYKNFHLADFEDISRRRSDLDRLYNYRRDLVRNSIAGLERRKRDLAAGRIRIQTRERLARELSERLCGVAEAVRATSSYSSWPRLYFQVDETPYALDKAADYVFWQAVADAGKVAVLVSSHPNGNAQRLLLLNEDHLRKVVPEGLDVDRWADFDAAATRDERELIESKIAFLRGADFGDLANTDEFTVDVVSRGHGVLPSGETAAKGNAGERRFAKLIDDTMESELARALVKGGYLDRNFALYAAQFYGHFTGLDVANFMVQNVQTNTMEVDFPFTTPEAVVNLLHEADEDFTHTVAAYNIDVLNYLLGAGDPRATNVVAHMVTRFDDDARTFLTAYLTSGVHRDELVASLAARPWRSVLTYLVTDPDVPDDARANLVSAALLAVESSIAYDVRPEVAEFIVDNYSTMSALTDPQAGDAAESLATLLQRAEVLIPDLALIDSGLRRLVVDKNGYQLKAPNLRVALAGDGRNSRGIDTSASGSASGSARDSKDISLDRVQRDDVVYQYCLARPGDYLAAVEQDPHTQHTVLTEHVLIAVLGDVCDEWNEDQVVDLVTRAAPSSRLARLRDAPAVTWRALGEAGLFDASLANVEAYRAEIGSIDEQLAALLENAGAISVLSPDPDEASQGIDVQAAAVAVLNATTFSSPAIRIALVDSLDLKSHLPVASIHPEPSELFSLLLEHDLVDDVGESFSHFRSAGWDAIGPAIAASDGVADFLTPDHVNGMVAELLTNMETREKLGRQVVERIDEFVPTDDAAVFGAVAQFAEDHELALVPNTVVRAAQAAPAKKTQLLRLLMNASPAADAEQITNVFIALGDEYAKVATPGAKFTVPYDPLHEGLLKTLDVGGRCTFRKKALRDLYEVQVA